MSLKRREVSSDHFKWFANASCEVEVTVICQVCDEPDDNWNGIFHSMACLVDRVAEMLSLAGWTVVMDDEGESVLACPKCSERAK